MRRPPRKRRGTTSREKRSPRGLHTFTITRPWCAPPKQYFMNCLYPFHVPIKRYYESLDKISLRDYARINRLNIRGDMPNINVTQAWRIQLSVPEGQAGFAENLIVASRAGAIVKGHIKGYGIDSKMGSEGRMPRYAWNGAESIRQASAQSAPMVQPEGDGVVWSMRDCKEAKELQEQIKGYVKNGNRK